jgi:hypothetical protein
VAKKPGDVVTKFLADLSKDPEKLGNFILNPKKFMEEMKIPKKHQSRIWRAVTLNVMKHLVNAAIVHQHH